MQVLSDSFGRPFRNRQTIGLKVWREGCLGPKLTNWWLFPTGDGWQTAAGYRYDRIGVQIGMAATAIQSGVHETTNGLAIEIPYCANDGFHEFRSGESGRSVPFHPAPRSLDQNATALWPSEFGYRQDSPEIKPSTQAGTVSVARPTMTS